VIAKETRAAGAAPQDVVVVELAATLTVTLPIALTREQLRPLANEHELASVQQTLRTTPPASEQVWLKRHKATRAKLGVPPVSWTPEGLVGIVWLGRKDAPLCRGDRIFRSRTRRSFGVTLSSCTGGRGSR
jgi:hypothetical protein